MKVNGSLAVHTNAVIAYREGVSSLCILMERTERLFLPAVVFGELLYGAAKSAQPALNEQAARQFLAQSALLVIDEHVAVCYAATRSALRKTGNPIPENDLLHKGASGAEEILRLRAQNDRFLSLF